jgi:hypothetical protein
MRKFPITIAFVVVETDALLTTLVVDTAMNH